MEITQRQEDRRGRGLEENPGNQTERIARASGDEEKNAKDVTQIRSKSRNVAGTLHRNANRPSLNSTTLNVRSPLEDPHVGFLHHSQSRMADTCPVPLTRQEGSASRGLPVRRGFYQFTHNPSFVSAPRISADLLSSLSSMAFSL